MGLSELSASDVAAVTGNNGGWGGDGAWWVIILLLAWGRNGFGGGGNCATNEDVRAAVDQQTLISKLDQQTYGLADSTYALNNTITQGFYNTISSQKDCCCSTQRMIEQGICDLKETSNANARAILDFMTNQKMETLRDENQTLKLAASQAAQNNYLISQLRPSPVPSYTVQNPYCCNSCGY